MMRVQQDVTREASGGRSAVLGLLALAAAVAAWVLATENSVGQTRASRPRGAEAGQVRVGEFAPDFELPRLTLTTDSNGKPVGVISETDTFRLSSFQGKKPVCLIMSSYT